MNRTLCVLLCGLSGVLLFALHGCDNQPEDMDHGKRGPGVMLNTDAYVWQVACPVLAGLVRSGKLIPNEKGQVSKPHLSDAIQTIGASAEFANFQALGVAAYAEADLHQNERLAGLSDLAKTFSEPNYVNIFTMQPADQCVENSENIQDGLTKNGSFPCNANPQNFQHGYSTTMRDMRFDKLDPAGTDRFKFWIEDELVDAPDGVQTSEKVLLFEGLGKILAKARTSVGENEMFKGDFSGEYSVTRDGKWEGSNLKKYHKEVNDEAVKKTLSVWQPLFAWAAWWLAFSRPYGPRGPNDIAYFTKTDLEDIFVRGKFPDEWTPTPHGNRDKFGFALALDAVNVNVTDGDVFSKMLKGKLVDKAENSDFWNPERLLSPETRYFLRVVKWFKIDLGVDTTSDNTRNTYTR